MRCAMQRQSLKILSESFGHALVHLVVEQPQRNACNFHRPRADLDSIKLIDIDTDEFANIEDAGLAGMKFAQEIEFQQTQLAISENKKVPAATRRIEHVQAAKLCVKLFQPSAAAS